MNEIIIGILSAIGGGSFAALVNFIANRKLVKKQTYKIDIETENIAIQSLRDTLEALRGEYKELISEHEKLKKELAALKREQSRLRKAIEKIQDCENRNTCPVSIELQNIQKDSNTKTL